MLSRVNDLSLHSIVLLFSLIFGASCTNTSHAQTKSVPKEIANEVL